MKQTTNRKVFVALSEKSETSEIDVFKLLSEAEIDLSTVNFIHSNDDNTSFSAADALIFVLFDQETADSNVEAAALEAARAGICHIVGIWAPGQQKSSIHPLVLKYGTAQIPWDADQLKMELGSDCANAFQTPGGDPADEIEIEPHECAP